MTSDLVSEFSNVDVGDERSGKVQSVTPNGQTALVLLTLFCVSVQCRLFCFLIFVKWLLFSFLFRVQKSGIVSALNSRCQNTGGVISSEKLKCTELHFEFIWKSKMAAICVVAGFFCVCGPPQLKITLAKCIKIYFWHSLTSV